MGWFENFDLPWAKNAAKSEPTQTEIGVGFEYMGDAPPTVEQFNSIFNMVDLRSNWLYRQLAAVIDSTGLAGNKSATALALFNQALRRLTARGANRVTASQTLSVDAVGLIVVDATNGPITLTLPGTAYMTGGAPEYVFARFDGTQNPVTIICSEGRVIEEIGPRMFLRRGMRLTLRAMIGGNWFAVSHSTIDNLLIGEVKEYYGANLPPRYLACNGQAVSRTLYAELFAAIGTSIGPGDNSTTFNVPDRRSRVAIGSDPMFSGGRSGIHGFDVYLGFQLGARAAILTEGNLPSHTHTARTSEAGYHGHSGSTNVSGAHGHILGEAGFHGHSGQAEAAGVHNHTTPYGKVDANIFKNPVVAGAELSAVTWEFGRFIVDDAGNHIHNLGINGAGSHAHSLTIEGAHQHGLNIDGGGSHVHAVTVDATGRGEAFSIMQPSVAANFIIYAGV
jgi:microcystin-dependent protein